MSNRIIFKVKGLDYETNVVEACTTFLASKSRLCSSLRGSTKDTPDTFSFRLSENPDMSQYGVDDIEYIRYYMRTPGGNTKDKVIDAWSEILFASAVGKYLKRNEVGVYTDIDLNDSQRKIVFLISVMRYTEEQYHHVVEFLDSDDPYKPKDPNRQLVWYMPYGNKGNSNHVVFNPGSAMRGVYKILDNMLESLLEGPGDTYFEGEGRLSQNPARFMSRYLGSNNAEFSCYWPNQPEIGLELHKYFMGE